MASTKAYLEYVLEQLSELDEITFRAMMGGYIIYYRGKIAAGIYADRFMVKAVPSAIKYMPNPILERPYDGAKPMILIDNLDNKDFLKGLFESMVDELSFPKPKKNKQESR